MTVTTADVTTAAITPLRILRMGCEPPGDEIITLVDIFTPLNPGKLIAQISGIARPYESCDGRPRIGDSRAGAGGAPDLREGCRADSLQELRRMPSADRDG